MAFKVVNSDVTFRPIKPELNPDSPTSDTLNSQENEVLAKYVPALHAAAPSSNLAHWHQALEQKETQLNDVSCTLDEKQKLLNLKELELQSKEAQINDFSGTLGAKQHLFSLKELELQNREALVNHKEGALNQLHLELMTKQQELQQWELIMQAKAEELQNKITQWYESQPSAMES